MELATAHGELDFCVFIGEDEIGNAQVAGIHLAPVRNGFQSVGDLSVIECRSFGFCGRVNEDEIPTIGGSIAVPEAAISEPFGAHNAGGREGLYVIGHETFGAGVVFFGVLTRLLRHPCYGDCAYEQSPVDKH